MAEVQRFLVRNLGGDLLLLYPEAVAGTETTSSERRDWRARVNRRPADG